MKRLSCSARPIGVVSYLEALYNVALLWNNSPVLELPQNEEEFEQMEADSFAAADDAAEFDTGSSQDDSDAEYDEDDAELQEFLGECTMEYSRD